MVKSHVQYPSMHRTAQGTPSDLDDPISTGTQLTCDPNGSGENASSLGINGKHSAQGASSHDLLTPYRVPESNQYRRSGMGTGMGMGTCLPQSVPQNKSGNLNWMKTS